MYHPPKRGLHEAIWNSLHSYAYVLYLDLFNSYPTGIG